MVRWRKKNGLLRKGLASKVAIYDRDTSLQLLPYSFHIIHTLLNEKLQAKHNTTIFPIYLFIYLN